MQHTAMLFQQYQVLYVPDGNSRFAVDVLPVFFLSFTRVLSTLWSDRSVQNHDPSSRILAVACTRLTPQKHRYNAKAFALTEGVSGFSHSSCGHIHTYTSPAKGKLMPSLSAAGLLWIKRWKRWHVLIFSLYLSCVCCQASSSDG